MEPKRATFKQSLSEDSICNEISWLFLCVRHVNSVYLEHCQHDNVHFVKFHSRTMQTAAGVFGGGGYIDGDSSRPLMVSGAGKSDQAAISSSNCPPFIAVEMCREHLVISYHITNFLYCCSSIMFLFLPYTCTWKILLIRPKTSSVPNKKYINKS